MVALLDVNVLIALIDPAHAFHRTVRAWVLAHSAAGWASCPLTQNGCVRILSQPSYPQPVALAQAIATLQQLCSMPSHQFWADDISLLDAALFDASRIHGPRQTTDAYLLGLAVQRGGRFVTLDGGVPLSPVQGASSTNLVTL